MQQELRKFSCTRSPMDETPHPLVARVFLERAKRNSRTAAPRSSPWSAAITLWIGTAAGTAQKKHGTQSFLVAVNSANHHLLPLWSDNTRFARPTNSCLH